MTYEVSSGAVVFTRENGGLRYVIVRSLEGYYGFPKGHVEGTETEEEAAFREIQEETGLSVRVQRRIATVEHAYSHFSITMDVFRCGLQGQRADITTKRPYAWIAASEISRYAFPKANHKVFEVLGW